MLGLEAATLHRELARWDPARRQQAQRAAADEVLALPSDQARERKGRERKQP